MQIVETSTSAPLLPEDQRRLQIALFRLHSRALELAAGVEGQTPQDEAAPAWQQEAANEEGDVHGSKPRAFTSK